MFQSSFESILFVALIISLVWLILYCFYLKNLIKNYTAYVGRINAEQIETRRMLRNLGKLIGYDLPCTLNWEKTLNDKK